MTYHLRPTITLVSVAIQSVQLSIKDEHFTDHHVPIFKLAGGGLFLLVSNFSVGDISSHVIFQLLLYFCNYHHHPEKIKQWIVWIPWTRLIHGAPAIFSF